MPGHIDDNDMVCGCIINPYPLQDQFVCTPRAQDIELRDIYLEDNGVSLKVIGLTYDKVEVIEIPDNLNKYMVEKKKLRLKAGNITNGWVWKPGSKRQLIELIESGVLDDWVDRSLVTSIDDLEHGTIWFVQDVVPYYMLVEVDKLVTPRGMDTAVTGDIKFVKDFVVRSYEIYLNYV